MALRTPTHNQRLGRAGEDLAARHLRERGHVVLDRNWRAPAGRGELDIVTLLAHRVVVVEVKTRSSLAFGHPFEAVGPAKLERLFRLGWAWCETHRMPGRLGRVDLVAVLLPGDGEPTVEHLEGVR